MTSRSIPEAEASVRVKYPCHVCGHPWRLHPVNPVNHRCVAGIGLRNGTARFTTRGYCDCTETRDPTDP